MKCPCQSPIGTTGTLVALIPRECVYKEISASHVPTVPEPLEAGDLLQEARSGRGGGKLYRLNPSKVPNLPKHAEPVPSEPTEPPSIGGRFRFGTFHDEPTEKCQTCSEALDPSLVADGLRTHPGCEAGR